MEIKILKRMKGYDGWPIIKGTADGHRFGASWDGGWKVSIHSGLSDWNRDRRMALHDSIKTYLHENEKELLHEQTEPNKQ